MAHQSFPASDLPALFAVSVALVLSACAGEGSPAPEARRAPPPDGAGPSGGRGGLFVSPSGEPFRASPGEPYPVVRWFEQADGNHDGALDMAEFRADAARYFEILDVNNDGVISPNEIARYERQILPEMLGGRGARGELGQRLRDDGVWRGGAPASLLTLAQMGPGGGGPGGGQGGRGGHRGRGGGASSGGQGGPGSGEETGAAPYGLLGEPEPVAGSDLNFDGKVTRAEFLTRADQRFHALDVKGTGALRLADLPKTAVQEHGAGQPGRGFRRQG